MTEPKTHRTRSGRTLTDEEIDALATEVAETDYDVEALKTRRRGRPSMGGHNCPTPMATIEQQIEVQGARRADESALIGHL